MQGTSTPSPRFQLRAPACVVVAHPDDESMFFAPTLASLARDGHRALVLCLSPGDFYGLGQTRKRELLKACDVLGVKEEDVFVVEHPGLRDGSKEPWPPAVVADHVREIVEKHGVKTLLTFDKGGVSGHADHAAVHEGVLHFHRNATRTSRRSATVVDVFELTTTGMFRKYSGLLDLPLSWVTSRPFPLGLWFVSLSMRRAWRAMSAHRSQFVWYRRLFVVFSRYAYINTFRRVPAA